MLGATSALCLLIFATACGESTDTGTPSADIVDIPNTKYVLENGLRLIVHEDHKAPIVAVNVWYDVGAGDEKIGKTGFAHLFEHLMFNGSEHFNDDYFKPFDRVGATGMNGTTNQDRTNYFQVVPTTALDMALWMESDRMGHMRAAVDQARLDEQRGVVQNEKRQGENQPYGKVFLTIFENTYPDGHPYDHSTIGSMEDLNAASLADVHEWFDTWYGAANAVLVVAGDVEAEDVKARVEKYFGHIPSGPPLIKPDVSLARRSEPSRIVLQDRVPQARVYKAWNVATVKDKSVDHLSLASDVLAAGKSSRLYKRLVYDDQIATDVSAFVMTRQFGSLFLVIATARPGQDLAEVEAVLDEELEAFLASGPTEAELARAQASTRASFIRGVERIGGFGGKSDVLAASEVYLGSPDGHKTTQANLLAATVADVHGAAVEWLDEGVLTVEVRPFATYTTSDSTVDRSSGPPEVAEFPSASFPARETAELDNGLRLILARRDAVPVVNLNMLLDAGYASDQFALPGTARMAMGMLDEGTTSRDALEISDTLDSLGANLGAGSNLDVSTVSMSALVENLDESLDLFADVILNPSFPEDEFGRQQQQQLAGIGREKVQPVSMAQRVLPRILYGEGHAYSNPLTGSGTEESVGELDVDALRAFHDTWFKPNNATLIVVGDITMGDLLPAIESRFANWVAGDVPAKNLADVAPQPETVVYLIDRPDSAQSIIFAGQLAPPKGDSRNLQIEAMNDIIGGGFTSRINLNLREDKGWSYGARAILLDAAGQRPYYAFAPVQTDRTAESMAEIDKEVRGIRSGGSRPPTADELAKVTDQNTLTLPGRWETNGAVMASLIEMTRFDLPDDYWDTFADAVRGVGLSDVSAQADRVLQPDNLVWIVVGDRVRIEDKIRALGLGEIRFLDADGNPVEG
ncbi:MAG: insulinase family protein [Holophagales bacterium]|nr:insulinase family protein [Holophagales bacterium]MYD22183.1 insulinase family protein [Holophagales bacterium]MYI33558.1 insulinase family protein [Holophagales bacterium]